MSATAQEIADGVVPLPPRRETCACGSLELVEDEVAPDADDDRFTHSTIVCYFLDEDETW